jgi:hypothetical protein
MTNHAKLTPTMRAALERAKAEDGLRRVHKPGPGRPPWPAHPSTLAALVDRRLLERMLLLSRKGFLMDTWTITDTGRRALQPPRIIRRRRPLFLAEGWPDLTCDIARAMRHEPEALREMTSHAA